MAEVLGGGEVFMQIQGLTQQADNRVHELAASVVEAQEHIAMIPDDEIAAAERIAEGFKTTLGKLAERRNTQAKLLETVCSLYPTIKADMDRRRAAVRRAAAERILAAEMQAKLKAIDEGTLDPGTVIDGGQ